MDEEQTAKIVQRKVHELLEHFDNVQIFVSTLQKPSGETASFQMGGGNWHARRGQIAEWMEQEDEALRDWVRFDE